jgi:hypothetical protein
MVGFFRYARGQFLHGRMLRDHEDCAVQTRLSMRGQLKPILFAVLISLAAASPAFAHGRALPAGPEWYVDDSGHWRSIREDWRNLQRVASPHSDNNWPSHKHRRRVHHR